MTTKCAGNEQSGDRSRAREINDTDGTDRSCRRMEAMRRRMNGMKWKRGVDRKVPVAFEFCSSTSTFNMTRDT